MDDIYRYGEGANTPCNIKVHFKLVCVTQCYYLPPICKYTASITDCQHLLNKLIQYKVDLT
jgi:hypothetical protein